MGEGARAYALPPNTPSGKAKLLTERLRLALAEVRIDHPLEPVAFTISVGIASRENDTDTMEQILKQADQALYTAKTNGRNQTVVARMEQVVD